MGRNVQTAEATVAEQAPQRLLVEAHLKQTQAEQERQEILERMARHGGNLSLTARSMGLSRTSLYRKLAKA
jgi:transcriptional regulator with PAS, ATPase and Fis domain